MAQEFFPGSLILTGVVLAVLSLVPELELENMHFIAAGVILAAIQLERNHQIQRMELVKDYMSRLFSDERLNDIL